MSETRTDENVVVDVVLAMPQQAARPESVSAHPPIEAALTSTNVPAEGGSGGTLPQHGITYFISGGAGSLRRGDLRRSRMTAVGFDADFHFMLFEVTRDRLFYQAITRAGQSVDAGMIERDDHPPDS